MPIDQFEEFLLQPSDALADKFLSFLHHVCQVRDGRFLVVATMRSDYLDAYHRHSQCLKTPPLCLWQLEPLARGHIDDVIVKPATRARVETEATLLERLHTDAPAADMLPLLAFTLQRLYREGAAQQRLFREWAVDQELNEGDTRNPRLELDVYATIGAVELAIKQAAEATVPPGKTPANVESAVRSSFVKHFASVNEAGEVVALAARWDQLDPAAQPVLSNSCRGGFSRGHIKTGECLSKSPMK